MKFVRHIQMQRYQIPKLRLISKSIHIEDNQLGILVGSLVSEREQILFLLIGIKNNIYKDMITKTRYQGDTSKTEKHKKKY